MSTGERMSRETHRLSNVYDFPLRPFNIEEGVFNFQPSDDVLASIEDTESNILRLVASEDLERAKVPYQHAGGTVIVRGRECRWTGSFPEERNIEGIALIIPGYGGFKKTSRGFRNALAELGIPAVSYEPLRDSNASIWENITDPQQVHIETVSTILDSLRSDTKLHSKIPDGFEIDYESNLLLPHSMGGLAATPYAHDNPDRVDAVYFLATVGFGSPTLLQLGKAFPAGLIPCLNKEMVPYLTSGEIELSAKNLFSIARYFLQRPDRAFGEMVSCLKDDVRDEVSDFKDMGITTAYFGMKHDILVPEMDNAKDLVDTLIIIENMGHMGPQAKARKLASLILATYQNKNAVAA